MEKVQKQHLKDVKGTLTLNICIYFKFCYEFFLADEQIPWLGAGIGIILGAIIVIADFLFTTNPTVSNFVIDCN